MTCKIPCQLWKSGPLKPADSSTQKTTLPKCSGYGKNPVFKFSEHASASSHAVAWYEPHERPRRATRAVNKRQNQSMIREILESFKKDSAVFKSFCLLCRKHWRKAKTNQNKIRCEKCARRMSCRAQEHLLPHQPGVKCKCSSNIQRQNLQNWISNKAKE